MPEASDATSIAQQKVFSLDRTEPLLSSAPQRLLALPFAALSTTVRCHTDKPRQSFDS
jgi:hypothetical protein